MGLMRMIWVVAALIWALPVQAQAVSVDRLRDLVMADDDLLCPLIRIDRLVLRAASQTRAARLEVDPATGAAMEVYYVDATARDACVHAGTADIDALAYEAVDVSIQSDFGAVSSRLN
jgi:hypothetical protein